MSSPFSKIFSIKQKNRLPADDIDKEPDSFLCDSFVFAGRPCVRNTAKQRLTWLPAMNQMNYMAMASSLLLSSSRALRESFNSAIRVWI